MIIINIISHLQLVQFNFQPMKEAFKIVEHFLKCDITLSAAFKCHASARHFV